MFKTLSSGALNLPINQLKGLTEKNTSSLLRYDLKCFLKDSKGDKKSSNADENDWISTENLAKILAFRESHQKYITPADRVAIFYKKNNQVSDDDYDSFFKNSVHGKIKKAIELTIEQKKYTGFPIYLSGFTDQLKIPLYNQLISQLFNYFPNIGDDILQEIENFVRLDMLMSTSMLLSSHQLISNHSKSISIDFDPLSSKCVKLNCDTIFFNRSNLNPTYNFNKTDYLSTCLIFYCLKHSDEKLNCEYLASSRSFFDSMINQEIYDHLVKEDKIKFNELKNLLTCLNFTPSEIKSINNILTCILVNLNKKAGEDSYLQGQLAIKHSSLDSLLYQYRSKHRSNNPCNLFGEDLYYILMEWIQKRCIDNLNMKITEHNSSMFGTQTYVDEKVLLCNISIWDSPSYIDLTDFGMKNKFDHFLSNFTHFLYQSIMLDNISSGYNEIMSFDGIFDQEFFESKKGNSSSLSIQIEKWIKLMVALNDEIKTPISDALNNLIAELKDEFGKNLFSMYNFDHLKTFNRPCYFTSEVRDELIKSENSIIKSLAEIKPPNYKDNFLKTNKSVLEKVFDLKTEIERKPTSFTQHYIKNFLTIFNSYPKFELALDVYILGYPQIGLYEDKKFLRRLIKHFYLRDVWLQVSTSYSRAFNFEAFYAERKQLIDFFNSPLPSDQPKSKAIAIFDAIKKSNPSANISNLYKIGNTKVFLRPELHQDIIFTINMINKTSSIVILTWIKIHNLRINKKKQSDSAISPKVEYAEHEETIDQEPKTNAKPDENIRQTSKNVDVEVADCKNDIKRLNNLFLTYTDTKWPNLKILSKEELSIYKSCLLKLANELDVQNENLFLIKKFKKSKKLLKSTIIETFYLQYRIVTNDMEEIPPNAEASILNDFNNISMVKPKKKLLNKGPTEINGHKIALKVPNISYCYICGELDDKNKKIFNCEICMDWFHQTCTESIIYQCPGSSYDLFREDLKYRLKMESSVSLDRGNFKVTIPKYFALVLEHLEKTGLDVNYIYRKNATNVKLLTLKNRINLAVERNQIFGNIDLKNLEAMTACTLITKYISSLKAPLINEKTFNNLEIALDNFKINDIKPLKSTEGQGATNGTALAKKKISSILAQGLDKPSLDLLQLIIDHFKKVTAHSDKNKMPVVALAICVGPSILAFKNRYNSIQDDIEMMSSQYDTINKITTLLIDLDLPLVA